MLLSISLGGIAVLLEKDWVDFSSLDMYKTALPSVVFDDEGQVLARFELDKRTPVSYKKLPKILVNAFVAAEDHGFFQHNGISLRGIVRSTLVNCYRGRVVQGASTITQQLARLMFLYHDRTFYRKFQEVFIAFQLERQLSKEQIFELYINNVYFGRGIYGVQAACKRFWNKSVEDISLDQAATLAAVAKSARLYSPLNAPANAQQRRNIILKVMARMGLACQAEVQQALKVDVHIQDYAPGNPIRLYVQEWIRTWAEGKWGKDALYRKGLKIKTTINTDVQEKAEIAFSKTIHALRQHQGPALNGGLVSIDPPTGRIKAMIGGYDFKQSQFNRATQAYRQIGSSYKPILYALALRAGIEMDTVMVDDPDTPFELTMPNGTLWQPKNWHKKPEGAMTLVRALTYSNNIIAIKLFLALGSSYIIPWTKLFGITRGLTNYPSMALGTAEASVIENVAAFNVFANNGVYVKPYLIEWVKGASGDKIWEVEPCQYRIWDSRLNTKMVNILSQRMLLGKRQYQQKWIDADAIGKTGSTNGAATTWFVGATPSLTTAVYTGRDDNKPVHLLAGRTTFPLWVSLYQSLKSAKKHFYTDPALREVTINWLTGQPCEPSDDPNVITLLR